MGKHNGKARNKQGEHVGALLRAASKKRGGDRARIAGADLWADRHTTDTGPATNHGQSVLEQDDLAELMAMADLADRDFAADREESQVMVVSGPPGTGAAFNQRELDPEQRAAAERQHAAALRLPRRPAWDARTTRAQLDAAERASFLEWRRTLARLEEGGASGVVLTPFERNLEVWRQLWRVLERSDVVVQVVDARDPLAYASADLAAAAREYCPAKRTLLLLNKSDLLPLRVRRAWADYFDAQGVPYAFWSAYAAGEAHTRARADMALLYPGGGIAAAPERAVAARARFHHRGVLAASPCSTLKGPRGLVAGGGGKGGGIAGEEGEEQQQRQQRHQEEEQLEDDRRTRVLPTCELLRRLERFARAAVDAREAASPGGGGKARGAGSPSLAPPTAASEEDDGGDDDGAGDLDDDSDGQEEDSEDDSGDEDDEEGGSWSEESPGDDDEQQEAAALARLAAAADAAAEAPSSPSAARPPARLVVGLVGYPNVGKSSTINAIFGSKKTAVAPTPGKTKHFQTLAVSPALTLCDCPGLVLPRVAASKADMVAAGVVPIDRLTDVRAPVGVVARRAGRRQLEAAYGLKGLAGGSEEAAMAAAAAAAEAAAEAAAAGKAPPSKKVDPPVSAARLLRSLARSRGWVSGAGMPDEARAGRQVLKDYTCGRLLHCALPPSVGGGSWAPLRDGEDEEDDGEEGEGDAAAALGSDDEAAAAAAARAAVALSAADFDLLEGLALDGAAAAAGLGRQRGSGGQPAAAPRRAGHKFHNKAAKAAARKGGALPAGAAGYAAAYGADEDGETLRHGKRGGIVRS